LPFWNAFACLQCSLKDLTLVPWACNGTDAVNPVRVTQVAALYQEEKRVPKTVCVVGQPSFVIHRVCAESQPALLYAMLVGMEYVEHHHADEGQDCKKWN
jgi:hypothetical protein